MNYLGLDAGGTKTHIALYNSETGLVDLYTGGTGNYEHMPGGYAELFTVLQKMLDEFLGKHGLTTADIGRAGFGMAGVDSKIQFVEIHKVLCNLGFTNFVLDNDCVLGVKAATSRGYGVACVCGSGFSCFAVGEDDKMLQLGGMGDVTGDIGGGGYTMNSVLAYVFGHLYKRYPASAMVQPVMTRLGITCKDEFMNAVHHNCFVGDRKRFTLDICKIAFAAAKDGDAAAINIMKTSAKSYGESVVGALDNVKLTGTAEIALTGSLFQKNPDSVLIAAISDYLKEHYGKPFVLNILDAPAVLGALVWAMGEVSPQIRKELGEKLNALDK